MQVRARLQAGVAMLVAAGAAWAQPSGLMPAGLSYVDAVSCAAIYQATGGADSSRWAATFRSLAIEIDERTNVDADIAAARDRLIWEARGSPELALANRILMKHGELLSTCGGYSADLGRRLSAPSIDARAGQPSAPPELRLDRDLHRVDE